MNIDTWRPLNARVQTLALRFAGGAEQVGGETANPAACLNLTLVRRSGPQRFVMDHGLGKLGKFLISLFLLFQRLLRNRNCCVEPRVCANVRADP